MDNYQADAVETPGGWRGAPPAPGHNSGMHVEHVQVERLKLDPARARVFAAREEKVAGRVIARFGVREPIVVSADGTVLVGEILYLGAKRCGLATVPVIHIDDLGLHEAQALSVAYARLGELGRFDQQKLGSLVLGFELNIPAFDCEDIGFEVTEIDLAIAAIDGGVGDEEPDEQIDALVSAVPVSTVGDIWLLGRHRILCGDSTSPQMIPTLMAGVCAAAVFSDPPFGPEINGFVAGEGRHREFVMGSGDMNKEELSGFFTGFIKTMLTATKPGAVVYLVIDWRSLHLLLDAAKPHLGPLLNFAVWAKDRAGMGSFLRSQHELILIFKAPGGRARNNVMLGKFGRNRSNVWSYPSAKTASKGSDEGNMLSHHPTPKPVRMVADALLDSTKRGDVVLDLFLGSGTTLIAAEKIGRICYAIDLDPLYVDLAVRRWQAWSGESAILERTGQLFNEIAAAASETSDA